MISRRKINEQDKLYAELDKLYTEEKNTYADKKLAILERVKGWNGRGALASTASVTLDQMFFKELSVNTEYIDTISTIKNSPEYYMKKNMLELANNPHLVENSQRTILYLYCGSYLRF